MQIPILIHANPKEVKDSALVRLDAGSYMIVSNNESSIINLGLQPGGVFLGVKNGFKFVVTKSCSAKVSIVQSGSEDAISMNLKKVEDK